MSADDFLLGHIIDPASGDRSGTDVAYDPSDLTTHGVIVGMTGSGKTGLGRDPAGGGAAVRAPHPRHRPEG